MLISNGGQQSGRQCGDGVGAVSYSRPARLNSGSGLGGGVVALYSRPALSYVESEGDADSSAAAFFLVVFFGDAEGEASAAVVVFFAVELFLLVVVDAAWAVVVDDAAMDSSFCCTHAVRNATIASAVIKDKADVFIGWN